MRCLNCGVEFEPVTVVQKYCCTECGVQYRKNHEIENLPIEFDCAHCQTHVVTEGGKDRRTRFCSKKCEKLYWKHSGKRKTTENCD